MTLSMCALPGLQGVPVISISAAGGNPAALSADPVERPDAFVPKPIVLADLVAAVGGLLPQERSSVPQGLGCFRAAAP
jgi:hypothetical protein